MRWHNRSRWVPFLNAHLYYILINTEDICAMEWSGQDRQQGQSKRETTAGVRQSGFILSRQFSAHTK